MLELRLQEKTAWIVIVIISKLDISRFLTILVTDLLCQNQLFSLPNGEPAFFLLHGFENVDLTKRILVSSWLDFLQGSWFKYVTPQEHGGRITDDDDDADVVLTISREEYLSLKDRYAISRKTHVRMSGFVDRCIDARRFQPAPVFEKGVPGRRPASR